MYDAFIIDLISNCMETKCSVPYWLHMSETTTTREKLGAAYYYVVTPACCNLKIYSECNETPKLHLSEDRRYFSGVRDLAFASIRISSAPFRKSNGTSFVRKGRGTSEAV